MALPEKQRAWRLLKQGKPRQALSLQDDVAVPSKLAAGQVLVRIEAAALNPLLLFYGFVEITLACSGYKMMELLPNFIANSRPHTSENDLAGTVVDGNGTEFKVGDKVFGIIPYPNAGGQGALAEYAKVAASNLALVPPPLTTVQAAGLSLAGMTAYVSLVETGKIEAGQTVFINGGSSGTGSFAIQIAKAKGCKVIASCSGPNVDLVKSIGADEVRYFPFGLEFAC
jgi:NADPH:quinone reductase-like Zn-dependent oxidoreductase